MNILGVNGKPVVVGGKVILPPSGVDVRLNAITPDRYQYSSSLFECILDLSGLITGNYFICGLTFSGERIDRGWLERYGITMSYVNSNPESEDKEQLYGACKYIFSTLLTAFPNADIVVILQPSSPSKGNYAMWLKEGIIREMAEMHGLPICDCIFEWHNPSNPNDEATYWADDNLHMTGAGHQAIMDKLDAFLAADRITAEDYRELIDMMGGEQ